MGVSIMANTKQIKQITTFLSAYPKDVAEMGIEAWRTGEMPEMEGRVTDVQVDKSYKELSEETKQFLKEQSEMMAKIMPLCKCGKKLNLMGVCSACPQGKEGFKSKFVCSCGYEEYFEETVRDKIEQLKGG